MVFAGNSQKFLTDIRNIHRLGADRARRRIGVMKGQTNHRIIDAHLPRALRNTQTDAERALWRHLQRRQLEGCKFRRQHPYDDYILDFVCLELGVVVELDGGQHAEAIEYDARRTLWLEAEGFVVLRFWNNDVSGNVEGVVEVIRECLLRRATPSPSNLPLEGAG